MSAQLLRIFKVGKILCCFHPYCRLWCRMRLPTGVSVIQWHPARSCPDCGNVAGNQGLLCVSCSVDANATNPNCLDVVSDIYRVKQWRRVFDDCCQLCWCKRNTLAKPNLNGLFVPENISISCLTLSGWMRIVRPLCSDAVAATVSKML